jgi:anti-anti-sigma regulatory factor
VRDRIAGFDISDRDGVVVAALEGEIDGSNAAELRLALSERVPSA